MPFSLDHLENKRTLKELQWYNGAETHPWYVGDPRMPKVLPQARVYKHGPPPNSNNNLIKSLIEGDFYGSQQPGLSAIRADCEPPRWDVDGSSFQPGVASKMTENQERSFFKLQAHDELNRTLIANVVNHTHLEEALSKVPSRPPNIIRRNKKAAFSGTATTSSLSSTTRKKQTELLREETEEFINERSRQQVLTWLSKQTHQQRDKFNRLFESLKSGKDRTPASAKQQDASSESTLQASLDTRDFGTRPKTAAVMDRTGRDVMRSLGLSSKLPDGRVSTPSIGCTRLYKERLEGVPVGKPSMEDEEAQRQLEARVLDLKKALKDQIYVKTRGVNKAWRWFDPNCLGYIDTHSLLNTMHEFLIPCSREEVDVLYQHMDIDGDGLVGFEDLNKSLFDTALGERDYFSVTQKPCIDLANEGAAFEVLQPELAETLPPEPTPPASDHNDPAPPPDRPATSTLPASLEREASRPGSRGSQLQSPPHSRSADNGAAMATATQRSGLLSAASARSRASSRAVSAASTTRTPVKTPDRARAEPGKEGRGLSGGGSGRERASSAEPLVPKGAAYLPRGLSAAEARAMRSRMEQARGATGASEGGPTPHSGGRWGREGERPPLARRKTQEILVIADAGEAPLEAPAGGGRAMERSLRELQEEGVGATWHHPMERTASEQRVWTSAGFARARGESREARAATSYGRGAGERPREKAPESRPNDLFLKRPSSQASARREVLAGQDERGLELHTELGGRGNWVKPSGSLSRGGSRAGSASGGRREDGRVSWSGGWARGGGQAVEEAGAGFERARSAEPVRVI